MDEESRPWLGVQWNNASSWTFPAYEHTSWLRVWNVEGSAPVMVAGDLITTHFGTWSPVVYPAQDLSLGGLPDGEHILSFSGADTEVTLSAKHNVTLLMRADGSVLPIETARPFEIAQDQTARFVNLSASPVSASVLTGQSLGSALPGGAAGPELTVDQTLGATLTVVTAKGATLSFPLPVHYDAGSTLLAFGGDETWPTLSVLSLTYDQITVVHPSELSATLRVYTAFAGADQATLLVDGAPIATLITRSWGKELVSAGASGFKVVPSGLHALALTAGDATVASVDLDLAPGSLTEFMVFPDGHMIALPALDPTDLGAVRVINAATSDLATNLFIDTPSGAGGANVGSLWIEAMKPGTVQLQTLPADYGLLSVDVDLDGQPDWKQLCGLSGGSTVLIIGGAAGQAIAQFYGDATYPVLQGKKL